MSENRPQQHACPICHGKKKVFIDDERECRRCEGKGFVTGTICASCGKDIPMEDPCQMFWDSFEKTYKLTHAACKKPEQRSKLEDKADRLFLLLEEIDALLCDKGTKQPRIQTLADISQLVKQRHAIFHGEER